DRDVLHVASPSSASAPRHSIDAFFRSLARSGGPMAIGVVLSGTGSDGTLGLKAIQDEGGITFAQEPSSAAQSGMPESAIDSGAADVTLTPAEIGDELLRLSAHPYVGRARQPKLLDSSATSKILARLRAAHGVDFSLYKQSTIERRIGRRMALHRLDKLEAYLSLLESDPNELRSLYNDLLIGVTSFFRDTEPFDTLKNVVFPRLLDGRPHDVPIRLWVAGCATGEEAYSVAIALLEFLGDRAGQYKIQIFATDVDDDALVRARAATYPPNIEIDVSPERLHRFFTRVGKGYQVNRNVRDLIVFARHNLGKDPPFSRLDLVTCRNVLIYMQAPLQKKVLRIFHYALNADAYLLLGTSESIGDAADMFWLLDRKLKVYIKKGTPAPGAFDFAFASRPADEEPEPGAAADHRPMVSVAQLADRKLIEKYGPPGVIVDEKLDVLQFRGRTGPFLEPAPGAATLNVLKLARPELLVALRLTVHKVLADGLPMTSPPVSLWSDRDARAVALDVMPLAATGGRKCLLILFVEAADPQPATRESPETGTPTGTDARVSDLARELATTKEYLQSTIEELEAANEELQSSNEELQSSNEELQSTNEELETSKEELQSTNEELATVNDELQSRMGQLSTVNDDLHNVLAHVTSAVVIVGPDMRIRRFSATAERLLSLIPADVGRPIAYLRNVMSARDIEHLAGDALASVSSREQRVRCIDGSWYMMKLYPYVTGEQMIRGVVIEFVKATAPAAPSASAEGDALPPLAADILSTLPHPVMLIDGPMRLVWANRVFCEAFALGPELLGRPLAEVWGGHAEPAELWEFFEDLLAGRAARDVLVDHPFGRAAGRPMRFSGKVVPGQGDRPALGVVTMQDV
ncbi:MAG TPA: CheR family methyltransferase, partial [Polyangiaceae bacterium]|nr:CheR family methyltransferase [Polyangiaceae bacterium]